MDSRIRFSLLLCTYAKDNPLHLAQCLESICRQTILPDELLIVKDGPLTDALENVITALRFQNKITVVQLPKNVSQGLARAKGMAVAKHEWVALMDSDDVCVPNRFEKQLTLLKQYPDAVLTGGQIIEYDDIPGRVVAKRRVPIKHDDIVRRAKYRNPFNTMTVMLNRQAALKAGNFKYFLNFEDYDLWARMMANGAICANHTDVLVCVRIGNGMVARRRGLTYIKTEWCMQCQLKKLKMINIPLFLRNVLVRIPVRLLPKKLLYFMYKHFARS